MNEVGKIYFRLSCVLLIWPSQVFTSLSQLIFSFSSPTAVILHWIHPSYSPHQQVPGPFKVGDYVTPGVKRVFTFLKGYLGVYK